jgi:hypothetical protein
MTEGQAVSAATLADSLAVLTAVETGVLFAAGEIVARRRKDGVVRSKCIATRCITQHRLLQLLVTQTLSQSWCHMEGYEFGDVTAPKQMCSKVCVKLLTSF